MTRRHGALVLAAVGLIALPAGACGNESSPSSEPPTTSPSETVEEAARRLRSFVDETVTEVVPGATPRVLPESGRVPCDPDTNDDEQEWYHLAVDVPADEAVPLVARIRERWK